MTSFLTLPVEVRIEIYKMVFDSIVLHFPKSADDVGSETALLGSCRVIRSESKDLWFQRLTFNFANPRLMLDTIETLPIRDCAQIRHVELVPRTWKILLPSKKSLDRAFEDEILVNKFSADAFEAFDSLPALQVESLVPDYRPLETFYTRLFEPHALRNFIRFSNGWKNVYLVYPRSNVLINGPCWQSDVRSERDLGTQTLNQLLQEKDGKHSGAQVRIFRPSETIAGDMLYNPKAREEVLVDDVRCDYSDMGRFWLIMNDRKEKRKDTLIIAERGEHARYDLKSSQLFERLKPSIRKLLNLNIAADKLDWTCVLLAERAYERVKLHRKANRPPLMLGEVIEHLQAKSDITYGLIRQVALKFVSNS